VYRVDTRAVGATFATLVRPRMNPVLSTYCTELLHIPQHEIDASDELPAVLVRLERWLQDVAADELPTCGWGPLDRVRLATNARLRDVTDPLAGRAHVDLRDVMTALRDHPTPIARDELRELAQLPPNPRRHRALDDALDLTHFLALLFATR
jgi:inhibitor of KinA sporulation pathway (predicted exonuclease)